MCVCLFSYSFCHRINDGVVLIAAVVVVGGDSGVAIFMPSRVLMFALCRRVLRVNAVIIITTATTTIVTTAFACLIICCQIVNKLNKNIKNTYIPM